MICGACFLMHFCNAGITTIGFSAYGHYLHQMLGFTNTQVSMILTVRSFASMVFLPLTGAYYKKLTLKTGMLLACSLLSAALVIASLSRTVAGFYLSALFMGAAYSFGSTVPITLLLHRWFQNKRSLATALALCGSGACSMVAPSIITYTVERLGLRFALGSNAAFVLLAIGIAACMLRETPPDEYISSGRAEPQSRRSKGPLRQSVALSKPEIGAVFLAIFFAGCVAYPSSSHMNIHFTSLGYLVEDAALACSLYGGALTLGKFLFGLLADRLGAYPVNYLFLGCWTTANFWLALLDGRSLLPLFLSSILEGLGAAVATVGVVLWITDLSGEEYYAHYIKLSQTIFSVGSLATTALPGILADHLGGYASAYLIFACLIASTLVLIQIVYFRQSRKYLTTFFETSNGGAEKPQ